jgi:hypothetical protein
MATNVARYSKPVMGLALLLTLTLAVQAAAPTGWFLAGTKPASYEAGTDAQAAYNGRPSVYLKAKGTRHGRIRHADAGLPRRQIPR